MKFRCERDVLADALDTAQRAVSNRGGALPVLSGVRLALVGDQLELTGSDLDLTISVTITVSGETDGLTVIPAKLAHDVVKSLEPGAVELSTDGDVASISGGRSDFTLQLIPAEEFPLIPIPEGDGITLDGELLGDALRQVVPAASKDDSRPILTGVLMAAEGDALRLVATDSYRLAVRDIAGSSVLGADQHVLVPSRALDTVAKVVGSGTLTLVLGDSDASFLTGGVRVTTRLIEGDFPNYRGLIPSAHLTQLTVARGRLIEALNRVKLMAREASPVRLTLRSDELQLAAVTQDVGEAHESIDAQYEGEELTVAFNPDYLINGLNATPGDEVIIETIDALKPALLRSTEGSEFLYLLMPVRVS